MKLLAVMGGPRKPGCTSQAVETIEKELIVLDPEVEMEYLYLSDQNLQPCRGCRACFDRGEHCCPVKDDVPAIAAKLIEADAVVFASPTYVVNMSGQMKILLDRLAYFCHRPAFHNTKLWLVTTTAGGGAFLTLVAMQTALGSMGFELVCKTGIVTRTGSVVPVPPEYMPKIRAQATRFIRALRSPAKPTLFGLVSYRLNRKAYTGMEPENYDARYWREKGWLQPKRSYYTDARPNPLLNLMADIIVLFMPKSNGRA